MKLEDIGLYRWFKSPTLTQAFQQARTQIHQQLQPSMEVTKNQYESHDSACSNAVASPRWCLFPSRACFLAYDLSVDFLCSMQSACDSALASSSAGGGTQAQIDAALQLLSDAQRRWRMEIERPDSTSTLPTVEEQKTNTAPTFQRAKSTPDRKSNPINRSASDTVITIDSDDDDNVNANATNDDATDPFVSFKPFSFDSAHVSGASAVDLKHPFALSYRAATIYANCIHYGIRVLERCKRYADANRLLISLLSHPYSRHRRGGWWNRLALNLESHTRDPRMALRMVRLGMSDVSVTGGDAFELQSRARRLWKHGGDGPPPEPQPDYARPRATHRQQAKEEMNQEKYSARRTDGGVILSLLMGAPSNRSTGVHSRFYDADNQACRVEELALSYYGRPDFGSYVGRHDEGTVFHALFTLFMWDAIFADIPDVWQTQYQDAPLDLNTTHFYQARRELITNILSAIRACTDLSGMVAASWTSHHGMRARGISWRSDLTLAQLQEIAECMGGDAIAALCDEFARDYDGWCGGMPDLCLWRPGMKPNQTNTAAAPISIDTSTRDGTPSAAPPLLTSTPLPSSSPFPSSSARPDVICISSSDDDGDGSPAPHPIQMNPNKRSSSSFLKSKPNASSRKRFKAASATITETIERSREQQTQRNVMEDGGEAVRPNDSLSSSASSSSSLFDSSWPSLKLVEVKGPNDRLSSQQSALIRALSLFITVEVCYIILPEQASGGE